MTGASMGIMIGSVLMVVRTGCARTAHLIAQIRSVGMMDVEGVVEVVIVCLQTIV
jgi:hypothetical protein